MKLNDNISNKNDNIYLYKFDFSKNDSFGMPIQNKNQKNTKDYNNKFNESNVDPRLELVLKYLDISSILPTFITNNIFFNDLLLLSKNDLVELGFSLVERIRILNFSQEFKKYAKKYNIQEINNFFNEFQNLNMRLMTINNNMQSIPFNEENEIINHNINNESIKNNENFNFNYINNDNNNSIIPNTNSLYLEEKEFQINNNNQKYLKNNDEFYPTSNLFPNKYNNKNQINKYKLNNNDFKLINNNISPLKIKNINNNWQDSNNQASLKININHNNSNNNQEINSSKIIRQNSKASKNSSYSKNSKSRLITLSKSFVPQTTNSGLIVQKFQNLSEEIDNYFKKYNNYKENKKNKLKKYQAITTSNKSKKKYNPIFKNNNIKNYIDKKNNNNLNSLNNLSIFNNNNENDMENNINNDLSVRIKELQKKKKELKEKLNTVCNNENKRKTIFKYIEEVEEDK